MPFGSVLTGSQRTTPPTADAELAALAARQHGLVTIAQLRAAGLTSAAVTKRMQRGVLHRECRGVYSVGHRATSYDARLLIAVFASGHGAVTGLSAAFAHEVWKYRPPAIHVVTTTQRKPPAGVTFHYARTLDPRDITLVRGIPVATVARMLVDLTDDRNAYELANLMHEAAYRRILDLDATRAAMARANGRRNLHVLQDAIDLHLAGSAGVRSRGERAFLALLERHGIDKPLVNTHACGIEVDFHWPARKLVVEIDGFGHGRTRTRIDDATADDVFAAAGYTVRRFPNAAAAISALSPSGTSWSDG